MAGKTLYEILGVAEKADRDGIRNAYEAAQSRLAAGGEKVDGVGRLALAEAWRILSDDKLRAGYNRKLAELRAPPPPPLPPEPNAWIGHARTAVILLVLLSIPAYLYVEKRKERAAAEKAAEQRRANQERERQAQELAAAENRRHSQQRAEEQRRRGEEVQLNVQEQRDRVAFEQQRAIESRQMEMDARNADRERERRRIDEENRRNREEYEARVRLENEKRRLREIECSRGPC